MMATRLQLSEREVLDAFDRAIKPLDETASMLTLNDRVLELILDELLAEDDPARLLGIEPWLIALDVMTPAAYELAMLIDDCDQAGHSWHGTLDQLNRLHDAKLASNPAEEW
jgi:hypothetical protein